MYVLCRDVKNIRIFYPIFFFIVLVENFLVYLYRRVFVMGKGFSDMQ